MNNLNLTIKFIFEHSTQEISFLGMKIYVRADHKLSTTLYRNPLTVPHFYLSTPTTLSNAKKALLSH